MSGNGVALYVRFLNRGTLTYLDGLPAPNSLAYTTDLRQLSGSFDLSYELALDEKFKVSSHTFAEIYFNLPNGNPFVVAAVYLEHIQTETDSKSFKLNANGRDLIGQLIEVPYKIHFHYQGGQYTDFVRSSAKATYIQAYCDFKNQDLISDLGAYEGRILFDTITCRKIGPTLQEYADLCLNLIYQNAKGQIQIYGRETDSSGNLLVRETVGTFSKDSKGFTNVKGLQRNSDYSKVVSDFTIFYTDGQNEVDSSKIAAFRNPDARAQKIYQPQYQVLASTDLMLLAGNVGVDQRRTLIAASGMRRSNQNLNCVTVTVEEPYYTDPRDPKKVTPYEKYQFFHVTSPDDDLDTDMVIVGIHYAQQPDGMEVQLALVEPDTLI